MSRLAALIPNKREFLARRLRDVGAVRLLERAARRPVLVVATYHRIGRPSESLTYDSVYSATPETFRAEVRQLRDRFRLIALDELLERAAQGRSLALDEPTALITFDDGYRDNFDAAFPILKELGVPATFFIPTGFFERPRLPWWDHAAFAIKQTRQTRLALDWPGPEPTVIDIDPKARQSAIAAVIGLYLADRIVDEDRFRRHLEERAEVEVDEAALGRALFMTWDDVRALAASGMGIGSHSHGHRKLATLPEEEQRRDLAESKRILEGAIGRPVEALAYPFGWASTYSATTKRLAREVGFRLAFSSIEGVNRPGDLDPFELRRLGVGFHDSAVLIRARMALHLALGGSPL